jgi:hypothetical protein
MNASNSENSISLTMSMASRTPASGTTLTITLQTPVWNLRISQLECPGTGNRGVNYLQDFYALAPMGCLQYYTSRTGNVMNLGYNPGNPLASNFYLPNMDYSVCFRREAGQCSLKLTTSQFSLGGITNAVCTLTDYLFVPESTQIIVTANGATPTTNVNTYCGTTVGITGTTTSSTIQSTGQFPLYMHFVTDVLTGSATENGWYFVYEIGAC